MFTIAVTSAWPRIEDVASITVLSGFATAILAVSSVTLFFLLPESKGVPLDKVALMWSNSLAGVGGFKEKEEDYPAVSC